MSCDSKGLLVNPPCSAAIDIVLTLTVYTHIAAHDTFINVWRHGLIALQSIVPLQ